MVMASRLGFGIDPPVQEAIREHRGLMASASPARLIEEYYKILRSGYAEATFRVLEEVGLLGLITPELEDAPDAFWHSLEKLERRLEFGRRTHRPDDGGTQRTPPAGQDLTNAPRRGMHEQHITRLDPMGLAQQVLGRHRLEEQGYIEFISTSFIRGMSFDDAIIIVDEMQNMTFEEIDTVMTRVGYRSKIIWCGDYRQTDLNKKKNDMSGILKFFDIAYHMKAFTKIEFDVDDIVRSSLVKDYIVAKLKYEDIT